MVKILNYEICQQDSQETVRALSVISAVIVCMMGLSIIYIGLGKYEVFVNISDAIGEKYMLVSMTVVGVGILTATVAFIGFLAMLLIWYNLVMAYFYFVVFTFMVQGMFGGFILIDGQDACSIKRNLAHSLEYYATNSTDRTVMNYLESTVHCCGVHSPWDYLDSYKGILSLGSHGTLPVACCVKYTMCYLGDGHHWARGCLGEMVLYVYNSMHKMGTVLVCSSTMSAMSAAVVYVHGMNLEHSVPVL